MYSPVVGPRRRVSSTAWILSSLPSCPPAPKMTIVGPVVALGVGGFLVVVGPGVRAGAFLFHDPPPSVIEPLPLLTEPPNGSGSSSISLRSSRASGRSAPAMSRRLFLIGDPLQ